MPIKWCPYSVAWIHHELLTSLCCAPIHSLKMKEGDAKSGPMRPLSWWHTRLISSEAQGQIHISTTLHVIPLGCFVALLIPHQSIVITYHPIKMTFNFHKDTDDPQWWWLLTEFKPGCHTTIKPPECVVQVICGSKTVPYSTQIAVPPVPAASPPPPPPPPPPAGGKATLKSWFQRCNSNCLQSLSL